MRFRIDVGNGFLCVMTPDRAAAVQWAKDAILNGHTVYDKDGKDGKAGSLKGMHRNTVPFPEGGRE
jgi:hypothetical protein